MTALSVASVYVFAEELDRCDPLPEATKKVAPQYPLIESPRPEEGYAIVEFTITQDGEVEDIIVVEAAVESGNDRFESGFAQSAVAAISKWKYDPRPRACRTEQRFVFEVYDE